ncbi:MAG: efflux RND transporter periplasmic adaptor subunit [Nitrospirota bacterium]|jgi:HlyD family secretion protein|nr:efflux RND transporter periplasmic adaptor subunit [Nitrospirota bacterium]MDH4361108.1 efflux RND transporter periplasmic adaptor subunit [Nitrospirota bacterium]MDH5573983.1 efflux RND transporter periplasmic adaptor subunit [Nitrospirota bacterium]
MRKLLWIGVVLIVGGIAARQFWLTGVGSEQIEYRTALVERGPIVAVVGATGTINPVTSVQVGAQVTGKIISLHADFNSVVKAGEVIARIDPSLFQARRDQAAANLVNAKAMLSKTKTELAQRKRELDRTQALFQRELLSQNDLDVALTAYEAAQAQVDVSAAQIKQAQALLETADWDLKYTVIRSPVNGIVIARNVEVGQTVTAGFTTPNIFLIALDLTKMQVDTNVSESDIGGIREGQEAFFTVDAYPRVEFQGVVRQVRNAPIIVQNVVTYDVVVEVDNQDLRLKPGMTANVSITVARKDDALRVPNAAFRFSPPQSGTVGQKAADSGAGITKPPASESPQRPKAGRGNQGGKTVWKLNDAGDPTPVAIQPGISDGSVTEVIEGELQERDKIIIGTVLPKGERKANQLPPGFGSGQRPTSSRDKGL